MTDAPAVPPAPSATVDGPADDTAPSTSPPPSLTGPELLALDPDAAAARWASLDDVALDAEVSAYRAALEGARAELVGMGRAVNLEDGQTGTIAGIEGVEGVDFQLGSVDDLDPSEWQVPPHCIPVHANVTTYDWSRLAAAMPGGWDVIMMDPPWQLATANPTRGVALGYSQLTDSDITALPIPALQASGFLFIWVINAKYKFALDLFASWGYELRLLLLVDEIVWVKTTVNRRLAKSHGYYLQHAKETCLVGRKGAGPPSGARACVGADVICAERRGQSQKPEEIYQLVEALVPNGNYLEIFGRKNNLRDFWVTVGNEVTGKGPPREDVEALAGGAARVPGAVYGAAR